MSKTMQINIPKSQKRRSIMRIHFESDKFFSSLSDYRNPPPLFDFETDNINKITHIEWNDRERKKESTSRFIIFLLFHRINREEERLDNGGIRTSTDPTCY